MRENDVPSDDVPIADAVDQHRDAIGAVPDEEEAAGLDDVPLEASGADWQEQHEVVVDPDSDEFDREG
jgi:hypothetical protein